MDEEQIEPEESVWQWILKTAAREGKWIAQRTLLIAVSIGIFKTVNYVASQWGVNLQALLSGDWQSSLRDLEHKEKEQKDD